MPTAAKLARIRDLLIEGMSVGRIRIMVQTSPNVVQAIRHQLIIAGTKFRRCMCGRVAGHKGMCGYRLSQLPIPRRPGGRRKKVRLC